MNIKSLILAFPVLCLACNNPGSTSDPANQMDASPILGKAVSGTRALTSDFNYDEPCNILGEEYIRTTFNLEETTALNEGHNHDGCEFGWGSNKVVIAFGGTKPFASIYKAEDTFDRLYQAKPVAVLNAPVDEVDEAAPGGPEPEGTNAETAVADSTHQNTDDKHPTHAGVTAATPPLTAHAVSKGHFEAVPNVGDKAVWDATTGAMHVLYNNHIISVTVETKGKPEAKKQQAESLADVLIDKISENEYTTQL